MVAREQFAGRLVKCPQCGAVVQIPTIELKDLSESPSRAHAENDEQRELAKTPVSLPEIIPFKSEAEKARAQIHQGLAKPQAARSTSAGSAHAGSAHARSANRWEDRSLTQDATPWLPGDEERFQKGVRAPSEGFGLVGLLIGVLALVVIGGAVYFTLK